MVNGLLHPHKARVRNDDISRRGFAMTIYNLPSSKTTRIPVLPVSALKASGSKYFFFNFSVVVRLFLVVVRKVPVFFPSFRRPVETILIFSRIVNPQAYSF